MSDMTLVIFLLSMIVGAVIVAAASVLGDAYDRKRRMRKHRTVTPSPVRRPALHDGDIFLNEDNKALFIFSNGVWKKMPENDELVKAILKQQKKDREAMSGMTLNARYIIKTPVTQEGLKKYDDLPATEAALKAWNEEGAKTSWHEAAKQQVRDAMPLLARALDRL